MYQEFQESQDISLPILVGRFPKEKKAYEEAVNKALKLVEKGAFITFVQAPTTNIPFFKRKLKEV